MFRIGIGRRSSAAPLEEKGAADAGDSLDR